MLISILICTKDRPEKLKETLDAVAALQVPTGVDFELMVIDNGSKTDGTEKVCRSLEPVLGARLRYVSVPQPGKSRAANQGFRMSRGEIIAFLDDDILPRQDWLAVIYREFSNDASLGGITGRVELRDPEDLQLATRRNPERAKLAEPMDGCNLFIGCNYAVRRAVIEKHGLYDPLFGPGSKIGSAEDLDFCYRIWNAGEVIVYEPSLFVWHAHGRRTAADATAIRRSYLVGKGAFYAKYFWRRDGKITREMYWNVRAETRDLFGSGGRESWRHLCWLAAGFWKYSSSRVLAWS